MTTTAHTTVAPTDAEWLKPRSRELRRWVDEAFEDEPDSYGVTDAVNKLTRSVPTDAADDQYFQRILLHPNISAGHVFTLLTLLVRHRQPDWRKPLPPPTLSVDEALLADVTSALIREDGGLDAVAAVYQTIYEVDSSITASTLSVLIENIRSTGGDRVTTAASLVRRVCEPDGSVPAGLDATRTAIISDFISRKDADGALDFFEATRKPLENSDILHAFNAGGGAGTEVSFMTGFSYGVRFAEEMRADMEEVADAARAFEADKRWVKRPLNEIRFVPGVGGAGRSPIPLAPELPDGLLARILSRAERQRAQADGPVEGQLESTAESEALPEPTVGGSLGRRPSPDRVPGLAPDVNNSESCAVGATQSDPVEVMMDEGIFDEVEVAEHGRAGAPIEEPRTGPAEDGAAVNMDVDGREDVGRGSDGEEVVMQEAEQPGSSGEQQGGQIYKENMDDQPGLGQMETSGAITSPIPVNQEIIDRILKERYRYYRTGSAAKKEELPDSEKHPGWKDAAWKTRDGWVNLTRQWPGVVELWKLDENVAAMVAELRARRASNHTIETHLKHISTFLSSLRDEEQVSFFGSSDDFERCKLAQKMAKLTVKTALDNERLNKQYTEKDKNAPSWPVILERATAYVQNNAAPRRITNNQQYQLVRRLYGLRVTILDHEPRRRDVFKVRPFSMVEDLNKENYVEAGGVLRLNRHKEVATFGEYAMQLTPESRMLVKLLEEWAGAAEEGKLTSLCGSEDDLSNIQYDIYEPAIKVKLTVGTLRRKYISWLQSTGKLGNLREQLEVSRRMGHSVWMQQFYYAKEETLAAGVVVGNDAGGSGGDSRVSVVEEGSSGQAECIVVDSDDDDREGQGAISGGEKRPAAEEGHLAPAWKKVKAYRRYPTKDQSEALRDIIRKERDEGKDGKRISWKSYAPLYAVLRDVDPETVRAWGNTERNNMDGVKKKQSPRRKGGDAEDEGSALEDA